MPEKVSQKLEIIASILVLIVIIEIAHFTVLSSDIVSNINKFFFFGSLGTNWLAILVSLVFLIIVLVYVKRRHVSPLALIFVLTGALTNIIDRFIHGGSVDYIKLMNIPLFNIPDVLIIAGLIIFFFEVAL